jgi:hypothetical protein
MLVQAITKLVYRESGSAAATNVVAALVLDVGTTIPEHLGASKPKVTCLSCIKWNVLQ